METQQVRQTRKLIDIAVRRKALIIACIMLGVAAGLASYLLQPKYYQSSTLVSYQQKKVNPAKMSPDDQANIRDIVSTLTQIVTSRTSLEQIIVDVGLYKEARQNLPMEDVIKIMIENIDIVPSRQGDTFRIDFTGSNPSQVVRVTNTIAAKFIEENLKYREERASETSSYTEDELGMAKDILDRKEAVMRDYKLKYYNEMSDQLTNNMSRLNSLQEQYQKRQDSIQDLERTRVLIQDQIVLRNQTISENSELRKALVNSAEPETAIEPDHKKLARLNAYLQALLAKYTGNHPDVKRVEKEIARLEQNLKLAPEKGDTESAGVSRSYVDNVIFNLQAQQKEIGFSIERMKKEMDVIRSEIEQHEQWISAAPVREAEWSSLTREYDELKRHYDFLVAQNLQARSALNLERKQKGSQFKIEDPARLPEKPFKPDFMKILGIALLAGCAVGGALSVGLELIDTSFRDPAELEHALDVEVICTVPLLPIKKEIARERLMKVVGTAVVVLGGSAIIAAIVYFWKQGRIIF